MGHITDDMTRLHGEVSALRNERKAFIIGIKADVSNVQTGYRKDRIEMAEKMTRFRNDYAETGRKMKNNLGSFVANLKADVSNVQTGYRKDRIEMAEKMNEMNEKVKEELQSYISDLSGETDQMLTGFRNDHNEMGRKMKNNLDSFVGGLKLFVAGLKQEVISLRERFAADITSARKAWRGVLPTKSMSIRQPDRPYPPKGPEPGYREAKQEAQQKREEIKVEFRKEQDDKRILSDDLTQIRGIGAGRIKSLNEAGIFTFSHLAQKTPEELEQILGKSAKTTLFREWIDAAKNFEIKP